MVEKNKRFVYGRFYWPGMESHLPSPPRPPFIAPGSSTINPRDQVALEVLREYGANELIGKLYFKGSFNQWIPIEPSKVEDVEWFKWYKRVPPLARDGATMYYFDMEGSGRWIVLHFRNESDETGPYVAVALRYST